MYTDVLLPTDGSRGALAAAGHGLDIARRYGATVHVLYVVDTRVSRSGPLVDALRDEGRAAVRRIEVAAATAGLTVVTSTAQGVPAREILAYSAAHGIDLVVMGTRGGREPTEPRWEASRNGSSAAPASLCSRSGAVEGRRPPQPTAPPGGGRFGHRQYV